MGGGGGGEGGSGIDNIIEGWDRQHYWGRGVLEQSALESNSLI